MTEAASTTTAAPPPRTSSSIIDAIDKLSYARKGLALLMNATEGEGGMDNDHIAWCVDHVLNGMDEARAVLDAALDSLLSADGTKAEATPLG